MTRRGLDRERDVERVLQAWKWQAYRPRPRGRRRGAPGSHGPVDVLALSGEHSVWDGVPWVYGMPDPRLVNLGPDRDEYLASAGTILMVQVKSTAKSPYEQFGRRAREQLSRAAGEVDAIPVLAWWPPTPGRAKQSALRWIFETDWPAAKAAA
jgi:hypothetical protein